MDANGDAKGDGLVGRAGLKLEAALEHFALEPAVRGARAVDVGASTGGFAQVLLAGGATSVVCVDTGHGQLHERLRRDPRIQNLERTDWKTLSLSEAPGPFDFFSVDVSFVAARTMLRGLAFRLRDGAEGVVLVKPQFELPDHLVKNGDVRDPTLRRQALTRFVKKADGLGFRVLAHFDSPVAGGAGTIEILTHVRFEGRPDTLPRPGERRAAASPPPRGLRPRPLAGTLDWFLVAAPGTEDIAAREAAGLVGANAVKAVPGGVELRGPLEIGMQANLLLRIPTRLLLRLCDVRAREFGKLRHQLARIAWEAWLPEGAPIRIAVSTTHCRLYHTGAIEEAVRAAIGDRTGSIPDDASAQTQNVPLVLVRGVDDVWKVSVDSSGERLHRRGWRTESGKAPLRESLAAALLALSEWTPGEALFDPMCGAGTIPIEACTVALGMAPGLHRSFAFEGWPGLTPDARARWAELRQKAASARRDTLTAAIVASDRNSEALAATRRNAARAGVESVLRIIERPLREAEPPAATGLFMANPPYGERLGSRRDLPSLYREIGHVLRQRFSGWRATIVVPDARLASAFRLQPVASHLLIHGGLRITALRFVL